MVRLSIRMKALESRAHACWGLASEAVLGFAGALREAECYPQGVLTARLSFRGLAHIGGRMMSESRTGARRDPKGQQWGLDVSAQGWSRARAALNVGKLGSALLV